MKRKYLLALMVSIMLILVMVVTSCAPAEPGATSTSSVKDRSYRAMNPTGLFIPVEIKPLAERLATIEGKTIYVCQGEADPVIMPALYKVLKEKYPKTTWIYYDRSDFGPNVPGTGGVSSTSKQVEDPDILKKVNAVIRGIGW